MRVLQSQYTQLGLSQKSRSLLGDGDDGDDENDLDDDIDLGDGNDLGDDDDAVGWAGHFRQVSDRGTGTIAPVLVLVLVQGDQKQHVDDGDDDNDALIGWLGTSVK